MLQHALISKKELEEQGEAGGETGDRLAAALSCTVDIHGRFVLFNNGMTWFPCSEVAIVIFRGKETIEPRYLQPQWMNQGLCIAHKDRDNLQLISWHIMTYYGAK